MVMADAPPGTRDVGRPRLFEDDAIFAATARVVARVGHDRTTLTAIAEEVGCSAPALVQRFGSKRALVRSFIEYSIEHGHERWHEATESADSPIDAIKARVRVPRSKRPSELSDPDGFPVTVFFHLAAWEDEALRPVLAQRRKDAEGEIRRLLEEATARGEIANCDEADTAGVMFAAFTGAALQFLAEPEMKIERRLEDLVDKIIAPYRV
jgi:AcrR family transcriptional regulator